LWGGPERFGAGFFTPVAFADDPADDSRVVAEEAFGPILPLMRYRGIDEVVERANNSIYGLGASVWGDEDEAAKVASRLEAGTVWINTIHDLSPLQPFGGHKQSGLGVENGMAGLLGYTNTKVVSRYRQPG
jgi:acyl-CoA reductase-like NAD-dependent aldehyde dehydrogenase